MSIDSVIEQSSLYQCKDHGSVIIVFLVDATIILKTPHAVGNTQRNSRDETINKKGYPLFYSVISPLPNGIHSHDAFIAWFSSSKSVPPTAPAEPAILLRILPR